MLRLENIPPSEMPEVVHIASELYEKDRQEEAETQERKATVDAAAEVGMPEEYLHRAAAQLHARRVAEVQRKRRRRTGIVATVAAVLVLGTGGLIATRMSTVPAAPPTAAVVQSPDTLGFRAANWKMSTNAGTQATVKYENGSAVLHVDRFAHDSAGRFTANLNSSAGAINLADCRTVSFRVHGTLPKVRLYLEHGNERWRSPALAIGAGDQQIRIDLNGFEHQMRADKDAAWRNVQIEPPAWVDNLSFKTGWYVNDIGASGDVTLGDIKFE